MRESSAVKTRLRRCAALKLKCLSATVGERLFTGRPLYYREIINDPLNINRCCNIVTGAMPPQPGLTREAFERFLRWLSANPDDAAKKYEEIRRKIVRYFIWKACLESDQLFDKTVDRVIRIIERGDEYSSPVALFYGVARRIWLENTKEPRLDPLSKKEMSSPQPDDCSSQEQSLRCLEICLAKLSESNRNLVTVYYAGQGHEKIETRKKLAAEHGGGSALRLKAFRIRAKLCNCVTDCLKQAGN